MAIYTDALELAPTRERAYPPIEVYDNADGKCLYQPICRAAADRYHPLVRRFWRVFVALGVPIKCEVHIFFPFDDLDMAKSLRDELKQPGDLWQIIPVIVNEGLSMKKLRPKWFIADDSPPVKKYKMVEMEQYEADQQKLVTLNEKLEKILHRDE